MVVEDAFVLSPSIEQAVDFVAQSELPAAFQAAMEEAENTAPPRPEVAGYEILGELGRGGMGVVYKARQEGLNRIVALKMILGGIHADSKELIRFRSEAEAVADLQHPNIVQIYDIGEQDGRPFFSLEFVPGGTLEKKIDGKPQAPLYAAHIVETLARTIHAAHQHGIIHRDLKPANVLLTAEGEPKITDFGLAKRLADNSALTATNHVVGTPSYMAPEQASARKNAISTCSDIYALGAILYEMLTGRPPFQGETPLDTMMLVLHSDPVPPRQFQLKLPRDLEIICLKCLHKEPRKRYSSAEALADDLRRFISQEPIRARPAPPWERVWKWARRRPTAAALVGMCLLVAVSVTLASLYNANRFNSQRAHDLCQEMERADIAELPAILKELANYRRWAEPRLQALAADEKAPRDHRLRASLALLDNDDRQVDYLGRRLLDCSAREFRLVRDKLAPYADGLQESLWRALHDDDPKHAEARFNAGMALAAYAPESDRWREEDGRFLTDRLLHAGRDDQPELRANLRPIASRLLPSLQDAFGNATVRGTERIAAADALADFARDRPALLARLASEATAEQYDGLLAALRGMSAAHEEVKSALMALVREGPPQAGEDAKARILRGRRRAGAAITLMHLGDVTAATELFQPGDGPEAMTQFIHRLHDRSLGPEPLLTALSQAEAPTVRYALLLALGEFKPEEIPTPQRYELPKTLETWYTTSPDSAVHGAAGWLLRRWSHADPLPLLRNARPPEGSTWLILALGDEHLPFVIFPPTEFRMGSPEGEPYRHKNEPLHTVRLTRSFAMAEREVTRGQFAEFLKDAPLVAAIYPNIDEASKTEAHPIVAVTWFEAVAYCRWLTEKGGLPESEQCYEEMPGADKGKDGIPKSWRFHPQRHGFRLPTEAEWECACRAGTTTAYSFGDDRELLLNYGRHLEEHADLGGLLRPNLRGLSDMHGNVWEWCHDGYEALLVDKTDPTGKEDATNRVLRGGGWDRSPWHCRSAYRHSPTPDYRGTYMGFRIVRTVGGSS
jgi:formylglycine-generating enzyme required for sulfatase activity/tRNA A-37 threonylcarbamoyl transferase component Bud32